MKPVTTSEMLNCRLLRRILPAALVMYLLGSIVMTDVLYAAGTAAGTVITTQASVSYTSADDGARRSKRSNTISLVVAQVAGINISPSTVNQSVTSDSILVVFPVTVSNTGNGIDGFALQITSSKGWTNAIYRDANSDGILQAAEKAAGTISALASMPADASAGIIVTTMVPRDASLSGQQDTTKLTVMSQFDGARSLKGYYITGVNTAFLNPRTLSVDNALPYQDQDVTFTLNISNSGAAAASNVVITDILDPQFNFISADGGATRPASDLVRWSIPSLAAGANLTYSLVVHIPATVPVGTVIPNAFGITYGVGGNTFSVSSNTRDVTVTQNPARLYGVTLSPVAWTLQKEPGDTAVLAMNIKNTGVNKDVLELSALSGDTAFTWDFYIDANRNGQFDAADTKLINSNAFAGVDADSVASGDSIRIFASTSKPLPRVQFDQTEILSSFTVSSAGNPGVRKTAAATTTMNIPVVSVAIAVSPASLYAPGDSISYTISYQNDGHATVDSFQVVNTVPAETQYIGGSVTVNGLLQQDSDVIVADVPGRVTVRARVGALSPSQHGSVTYRARIK